MNVKKNCMKQYAHGSLSLTGYCYTGKGFVGVCIQYVCVCVWEGGRGLLRYKIVLDDWHGNICILSNVGVQCASANSLTMWALLLLCHVVYNN